MQFMHILLTNEVSEHQCRQAQFLPTVAGSDFIAPSLLLGRAPQRITITLPYHVYNQIAQRSTDEGRSMSNLSAYLLERAAFG